MNKQTSDNGGTSPSTADAPASVAENAPSSSVPPPKPRVSRSIRFAPWIAVAAVIGLFALVSTHWSSWVSNAAVQTTDNAFIKSDTTALSAKAAGYIRSVHVEDFQNVKAGDLIAEIEDDDYRALVAQSEAALAKAKATLDNLDNEEALQRAAIAQAEASQVSNRARLTQAVQEAERQESLAGKGFASQQKREIAVADRDAAAAAFQAGAASVDSARRQLDVLTGQRAQRLADVRASEAALRITQLNLSHTRLVAPFDGVVNVRRVQPGSYVTVGTRIIDIVPLPKVHIVANYKETQLTNVQPGQPVSITIDSFPGETLRGRVEKIAPSSGAESALIPADNATGNFTKVVQRIAVRITLEPGQNLLDRLRPGMSVETSINTRDVSVPAYAKANHTSIASIPADDNDILQ